MSKLSQSDASTYFTNWIGSTDRIMEACLRTTRSLIGSKLKKYVLSYSEAQKLFSYAPSSNDLLFVYGMETPGRDPFKPMLSHGYLYDNNKPDKDQPLLKNCFLLTKKDGAFGAAPLPEHYAVHMKDQWGNGLIGHALAACVKPSKSGHSGSSTTDRIKLFTFPSEECVAIKKEVSQGSDIEIFVGYWKTGTTLNPQMPDIEKNLNQYDNIIRPIVKVISQSSTTGGHARIFYDLAYPCPPKCQR